MLRRVLLILLATLALNSLVAVGLVLLGGARSFPISMVQSQAIGLTIAGLCWSVAPRVARAQGELRVAVPLFGAAIGVGALLGMVLADAAAGLLFPEDPRAGVLTSALNASRAALISLVVGVLGTVFFWGRERLRHARTRADAEQWRAVAAERSAAQAQLQSLRAQVEPHFLFNTLANVSALIERDPPAARALIDDLARHLRATLRHARADSTTLGEELAVVRSLLGIMKRRLGDRLQWRFDVPEALHALAVPPMVVQPLVENAIKHGIEPITAGGTIEVRARRDEDGSLVLEVADTGRGFAADGDAGRAAQRPTDGGTGLANLGERLRAIYGPTARLALLENRPRGAVARLTLPPPDPARAPA